MLQSVSLLPSTSSKSRQAFLYFFLNQAPLAARGRGIDCVLHVQVGRLDNHTQGRAGHPAVVNGISARWSTSTSTHGTVASAWPGIAVFVEDFAAHAFHRDDASAPQSVHHMVSRSQTRQPLPTCICISKLCSHTLPPCMQSAVRAPYMELLPCPIHMHACIG